MKSVFSGQALRLNRETWSLKGNIELSHFVSCTSSPGVLHQRIFLQIRITVINYENYFVCVPVTIGKKILSVANRLFVGIKGLLLNWKCVILNLSIPVQTPRRISFRSIIFKKLASWNSSRLFGIHNADSLCNKVTIWSQHKPKTCF